MITETTVVDVASTVSQAFAFEVDKLPLYGPENLQTDLYGLFRDDTGAHVGVSSVKKGYRPHTTDDVVVLSEAASTAFDGPVTVRTHFDRGHVVEVSPTDDERRAIYGDADNVFPRFVIRAGYGGKPFRVSLGYYRDLCSNLEIPASVAACTASIRHTSGLRGRISEVRHQLDSLAGQWDRLVTICRDMEARSVKLDDFLDRVYGEVPEKDGRSRTIHTRRRQLVLARIRGERVRSGRPVVGGDRVVSAWEAFNGVQGHAQHDATRRGNPSQFERALSAAADRHVMAAERLAMAV